MLDDIWACKDGIMAACDIATLLVYCQGCQMCMSTIRSIIYCYIILYDIVERVRNCTELYSTCCTILELYHSSIRYSAIQYHTLV
jgi:hypothetical protein